jgi:hypothetical protein
MTSVQATEVPWFPLEDAMAMIGTNTSRPDGQA